MLLQTVRCNPDLTVFPMQWFPNSTYPVGLDEGHHRCTVWEKIDGWMQSRSFDPFQKGLLMHPSLGKQILHRVVVPCLLQLITVAYQGQHTKNRRMKM